MSRNVVWLTVLSLEKLAPVLTGWERQEFIFMWWNVYICAIPVFSYNFICMSPLSHACCMICMSLTFILSTEEHSFVPFNHYNIMYDRKVEASRSKPHGNLWCNGINVLDIKMMMKVTELHFMPCLWFVFLLFKAVSILQYCNLSLVWESLFIHSFIHLRSVNPYKVSQPIGYRTCHNINVS